MNNTKKTRTTLAIVAILTAATLVVGTFATTTTLTQTALAFSKNKKGDENSKNGNTITALKCQNNGSASGFDTALDQECENVICTHPGDNATCVQEGLAAAAAQQGNQTTPVKQTCEECLTKFLNADQILLVTRGTNTCAFASEITTEQFQLVLLRIEAVTRGTIDIPGLIQCLLDAGVQFSTGTT